MSSVREPTIATATPREPILICWPVLIVLPPR